MRAMLGSQVQVGESYAAGKSVAVDPKQAVFWYKKAADQGNISGELHLAALYRDGAGKTFPRDIEQAAAWYRKAADAGDPGAQGTLGILYAFGQGVPRNDVEAYFWLDLAAAVKSPSQRSMRPTGRMWARGSRPISSPIFRIARRSGRQCTQDRSEEDDEARLSPVDALRDDSLCQQRICYSMSAENRSRKARRSTLPV